MELNYLALGQRIAKRRGQAGLKQQELAEIIGISNNHLSNIECGKQRLTLEIMVKICNALKVTPDYLIMGNMHSGNVPQNIVDGLQLCSEADISLLSVLVEYMIERDDKKWNNDNFA